MAVRCRLANRRRPAYDFKAALHRFDWMISLPPGVDVRRVQSAIHSRVSARLGRKAFQIDAIRLLAAPGK